MKKINEAWVNYSARLCLIGFNADALKLAKKMFFSGSISTINILTEGEPENADTLHDVSELVEEIKIELNEYSEESDKVTLFKPSARHYKC